MENRLVYKVSGQNDQLGKLTKEEARSATVQ